MVQVLTKSGKVYSLDRIVSALRVHFIDIIYGCICHINGVHDILRISTPRPCYSTAFFYITLGLISSFFFKICRYKFPNPFLLLYYDISSYTNGARLFLDERFTRVSLCSFPPPRRRCQCHFAHYSSSILRLPST